MHIQRRRQQGQTRWPWSQRNCSRAPNHHRFAWIAAGLSPFQTHRQIRLQTPWCTAWYKASNRHLQWLMYREEPPWPWAWLGWRARRDQSQWIWLVCQSVARGLGKCTSAKDKWQCFCNRRRAVIAIAAWWHPGLVVVAVLDLCSLRISSENDTLPGDWTTLTHSPDIPWLTLSSLVSLGSICSVEAAEFSKTTLSGHISKNRLHAIHVRHTYRSSISTTFWYNTSGLLIERSKILGLDWLPNENKHQCPCHLFFF